MEVELPPQSPTKRRHIKGHAVAMPIQPMELDGVATPQHTPTKRRRIDSDTVQIPKRSQAKRKCKAEEQTNPTPGRSTKTLKK